MALTLDFPDTNKVHPSFAPLWLKGVSKDIEVKSAFGTEFYTRIKVSTPIQWHNFLKQGDRVTLLKYGEPPIRCGLYNLGVSISGGDGHLYLSLDIPYNKKYMFGYYLNYLQDYRLEVKYESLDCTKLTDDIGFFTRSPEGNINADISLPGSLITPSLDHGGKRLSIAYKIFYREIYKGVADLSWIPGTCFEAKSYLLVNASSREIIDGFPDDGKTIPFSRGYPLLYSYTFGLKDKSDILYGRILKLAYTEHGLDGERLGEPVFFKRILINNDNAGVHIFEIDTSNFNEATVFITFYDVDTEAP